MCGITGIWHLSGNPVEKDKIQRFNDSLEHRGPDGFGTSFHLNGALALGHRRLSILDLSEAGKQPMTYAHGKLTVTFNGEIFNFIELREELKKLGYQFRSDTDTEVVLAAYYHWGKRCFDRFNGMWAMAIWDERTNELLLSRDRFGIKPLYYLYRKGQIFAFASETLAFKSLHGFDRTLNNTRFDSAVRDPIILEGRGETVFDQIQSLLPGHTAVLNNHGFDFNQWWKIDDHIKSENQSLSESVEYLDYLLVESTKLRMISDVPIATALSGGIDSTTVFGYVNRLQTRDSRIPKDSLSAYTVSFNGLESDELPYATEAASFFNKELNVVRHSMDDFAEQLVKTQKMLDAYSPAPILAISEVYRGMKKDGRYVSMDGHGVDEILFGYRGMVDKVYYRAIELGDTALAKQIGTVKIGLVHSSKRSVLKKRIDHDISAIDVSLSGNLKRAIDRWVYGATYLDRENKPLFFDSRRHSFDEIIPLLEFTQTTLPTVLRNFDRAGMMNGVEIRMPFMDYRLVTYLMGLSLDKKLQDGYTKYVLRESQKGKIPEDLRTRTYKVGVGNPLLLWMNHEKNQWIYDLISAQSKTRFENQISNRTLSLSNCQDLWLDMNKTSFF